MFALDVLDASGHGLWLGAPWPRITSEVAERTILFTRVAAHLTSAGRLCRSGVPPARRAEAVLSRAGALVHAEGGARDEDAPSCAAPRSRSATPDREEVAGTWTPRPSAFGRWSIIDEFEESDRRYVFAVDNRPPEVLTKRASATRTRRSRTSSACLRPGLRESST